MKFPQSVDLAIHSLWYMAYNQGDEPLMVKELAKAQNVSESYLAKLFQSLAKTDIVQSSRGKNGGYVLNREPRAITVGAIVRAIEGDEEIFECAYEPRGCKGDKDCGLRSLFNLAASRMYEVLDSVSLEDLKGPDPQGEEKSRPWLEFRYQREQV